MAGSGTVHNYLWQVTPDLLGREDVFVLEGATQTGIRLLSEAYLYEDCNKRTFSILAMASKRLEKKDFIHLNKDDEFFEVHIGNDTLQVTFGAPTEGYFRACFENSDFPLIETIKLYNGEDCIKISDLKRWVWRDSRKDWESQKGEHGYIVYLTTKGSATRFLFEENLRKPSADPNYNGWPDDHRSFKRRAKDLIKNKMPWIALSSRVLNEDDVLLKSSNEIKELTVLGENGKPIQRGLLLYGRIPKQDSFIVEKGVRGYALSKRTCVFLNDLFIELENADKERLSIGKDLLKKQEAYFNLCLEDNKKKKCWIKEDTNDHSQIYRP